MNKICTSIEQSKKLIELGIDVNTADMYWAMEEIPFLPFPVNDVVTDWEYAQENGMLPAWSLSALLELMPRSIGGITRRNLTEYDRKWNCFYTRQDFISVGDNPLDAVFEMVCWLKENKII